VRNHYDKKSKYRGDVIYEVWRRGGNPDLVDYDRVDDYYYENYEPEYTASIELNLQR